tara:strand:+ start:318 stop:1256 length:939 start_codon:yes stop_codon:yes gene_type:complete
VNAFQAWLQGAVGKSRLEEVLALLLFCPMLILMLQNHDHAAFRASDINRIVVTGIVLASYIVIVKVQVWLPDVLVRFMAGGIRFMRDALPFMLCIVIYTNMHNMVHIVNPNDVDPMLAEWDLALLGFHPAVELQPWVTEPLTDTMAFAYSLFFIHPLILPLILYWRGQYEYFRYTMVCLILTFYVGYIGYILFPATGPKYELAELFTVRLNGTAITNQLEFLMNVEISERTRRDAFPSLHNAITLQTLLFAALYVRWYFWLMLPLALLLFAATIYLRYHYVVDMLAGYVLALVVFWLGPKLERAWNRWARLY